MNPLFLKSGAMVSVPSAMLSLHNTELGGTNSKGKKLLIIFKLASLGP